MVRLHRFVHPLAACLAILAIASCSGDSPTGPPAVASVQVTPGTGTLVAIGATTQLTAAALDRQGTAIPGQTITWTSSASSVASVSSTGLVTALTNGSATITATVGTIQGAASVTVLQSVATIAVSPDTAVIVSIGDTVRYAAVARDANGVLIASPLFAWTSSNPSIVTVSPTGLVTAVANGPVQVRATSGGVTASAIASVVQAVAAVVVTPDSTGVLAVGQTAQFTAAARDANNVVVAGARLLWISSNHNIATVNSTGLVTAVGSGVVTITAAAQGVPGYARFSVVRTIASVVVTSGNATLNSIGQTRQMVAEARDAATTPVAGASFTWATSNAAAATVSSSGLVTAVGNGVATITATANSVDGTATATVAQLVSATRSVVSVSPGSDVPADGFSDSEISVTALDENGYPVPGVTVTLAAAATPNLPGAALTQPAAVTSATGTTTGSITSASFGAKQITATAGGVAIVQRPAVSFGATRIGWSTQPTNRTSGQRMNNMAVAFYDANNNVVTTAIRPITVALTTNPGSANVYGTLTRSPVNGVVTYNDVALDFPGTGSVFTASVNGFSRFSSMASSAFNVASFTLPTANTLLATASNCDDCSEQVILGFDFNFNWYGSTFQIMSVTSNGMIAFTSSAITTYVNTALPNAASPNGVIAPFWDDLQTATGGDVYWQITGAAPNRQIVVEYRAVSIIGPVGNVSLSARLSESDRRVEFIYGAMTATDPDRATGNSASIGVENGTGTVGYQVGFNTANRVRPGTRIILDWNGVDNYVRTFLP